MEEENVNEHNQTEVESPKKKGYRQRVKIGMLLLELFTVSFGVLLGFWINSLKEQYNEQKKVDQAIVQVNEEMQKNLKKVEHSLSENLNNFQMLMKKDDTIQNHDLPNKCLLDVLDNGVLSPFFTNNAFESAIQQGLTSSMDMSRVVMLSAIKNGFDYDKEATQNILRIFYNPDSYDPKRLKIQYKLYILGLREIINEQYGNRMAIVKYMKTYDSLALKDTMPIQRNINKLKAIFNKSSRAKDERKTASV